MPTPRRLLILLALAASACALCAPAALAGARADGQGVVLSAASHTLRLVDKAHRVGDVRVGSAKGLRRGDVVRVRKGRARVTGRQRRIAFLGRVVRSSGRGAVVRLGDGSTFKLAPGRRLALGRTVLVTLALGRRGDAVVKIELRRAGTPIGRDDDRGGPREDRDACDADTVDEDDACAGDSGNEDDWLDVVDGTVTALADDGWSLTLAPDEGDGEESYRVEDPILLDGIAVGDAVSVTLDEDGTAIDVELLDWSEDPDPLDPGDDGDDGEDF